MVVKTVTCDRKSVAIFIYIVLSLLSVSSIPVYRIALLIERFGRRDGEAVEPGDQ